MKNVAIILIVCLMSCDNEPLSVNRRLRSNTESSKELSLPFVGKRWFDMRPGLSGTGTPHKFVEIMRNGDVYFSFEQENQADKTLTTERYSAGKYTRYMKCVFKKMDNEITFYELITDAIYEVDENKKRLKSVECCDGSNIANKNECVCKSKFFLID